MPARESERCLTRRMFFFFFPGLIGVCVVPCARMALHLSNICFLGGGGAVCCVHVFVWNRVRAWVLDEKR